jgi:hypothetical protein
MASFAHADWSHMDWAVFTSTLVLAAATFALVWFTRRLVKEATAARDQSEKARLLGVRPRLALSFDVVSADIGFVTVTNVGSGPAIDVDALLNLGGLEQRVLGFHLMEVGEKHQFMAHNDSGAFMRLDEFTGAARQVSLAGSMRDVLDNQVDIDEEFDFAEAWERLKVSGRRQTPDETKRLADEAHKIRTTLERLQRTADRAYYAAWPEIHETGDDEPDNDETD